MNFSGGAPAVFRTMSRADPFTRLSAGYDDTFSRSTLGRLFRAAVLERLDTLFSPGDRVLELGCGTGEDALHLARRGVRVVAVDSAPGMVAEATDKVARAGFADRVRVVEADVGTLRGGRGALDEATGLAGVPFDGAFSDFGVLNCLDDLSGLGTGLAECLRPGARVLLCVMGPWVPWEWLWFLGRGEPARAFRRLRPGGTPWRGLTIRYPSIRRLARALAPELRLTDRRGVGIFLPPSYAEGWAMRHPAAVRRLAGVERRLASKAPFPWLADHHVTEYERT